jgi:riboflavin kinase / FMN adenylyltransferase
MKIHYGYNNIKAINPVVTLGIFDGVHRGHRVLLDRLINRADEVHGESVVLTFHPHPRLVLEKDNRGLTFLTTMEEKISLLEKSGVANLVIIEFTREFSLMPACDFVNDVLIGRIGTRYLIVGYDHHFGRRGEGDFNTIVKCTESSEFKVEKVEGLESEKGAISSSLIREALLTGKADIAAELLGYRYSLSGKVIEGKKLGRTLGFPTANILPSDSHKLIPQKGVYAVEVFVEGRKYPGMLNIGSNPTVSDDPEFRSIEVNIIGFSEDIYGSPISIVFVRRLRDELKFESLQALIDQMDKDKQATIRIFSGK